MIAMLDKLTAASRENGVSAEVFGSKRVIQI
jgi:hypothetical protein